MRMFDHHQNYFAGKSDAEIAEELGQHLVVGRKDPSDPEACFEFLYSLDICNWRILQAHFEAAIEAAGQQYIADAISRRVA